MRRSQAQTSTPSREAVYPPESVWQFPFRSGRLCLDFVATLGSRRKLELERLRAPDDLRRWSVESGIGELPRIETHDLARALQLREAIYGLVTGDKLPPNARSIGVVNRAAALLPLIPRLDPSGHTSAWLQPAHLDQALSSIARDAIDLLSGPLSSKVKACAGADCTILFVDTSRPGTRRWCSMDVCGNQVKSASLRAKRQAGRVQPTDERG